VPPECGFDDGNSIDLNFDAIEPTLAPASPPSQPTPLSPDPPIPGGYDPTWAPISSFLPQPKPANPDPITPGGYQSSAPNTTTTTSLEEELYEDDDDNGESGQTKPCKDLRTVNVVWMSMLGLFVIFLAFYAGYKAGRSCCNKRCANTTPANESRPTPLSHWMLPA
jgi:hypothetical protein